MILACYNHRYIVPDHSLICQTMTHINKQECKTSMQFAGKENKNILTPYNTDR